ncbi:flavodoxin family protein [Candidatus Magnetominusculus xianensis]|uniref:NADPH-dependent FMN reductase n=1 Tax=Candidatus Magnetominusculus xianensis TaxID=1748249 RepID=A0ABR5SCC1_9BACT|nr:flavodoxin family protein [Candidatus Magnetominusculus xianensis]KWT79630.1 NADPH-dependent FMN reductase [Candidatus Magnetominusculus xianensis]MBF0403844.1 flavodoxin family protein [Nitrospirota bacterium]
MKITAILGSPRVNGNTEILLNEAIRAVKEEGCPVDFFRPHGMDIAPCSNCGGCDDTGKCVIEDDMQDVYRAIYTSDRFIVASPIFFFGLTAQIKGLIDRCQALWCEKYLLGRPIPQGHRKGLLLMVGGMDKEIGFKSGGATATAFFRTISVPKHETIYFTKVDAIGAIREHPTALKDVYEAAKRLII